METQEFNNDLKTLSLMVGSFDSDELFYQSYKELLEKIRPEPDRAIRAKLATKMHKVLMRQCQFMMNEWLREKRSEHNAVDTMALSG